MTTIPVITLDGTSGVGKGTICMRVARQLGWHILDSGSLYRLTALQAMRAGVPDDEEKLADIAENLQVEYRENRGELEIFLANEAVSLAIRSEAVASQASRVAAMPAVRAALLARQRAFLQAPGLVADGRDMGTVVFPDAPLKIFLTASVKERALRRYKQLKEKGIDANLCSLEEDLTLRDQRDMNRATAPLKPAADAVVIDTTDLDIDGVFEQVMRYVDERINC